jgi:hypothetical protein
MTSNIAHRHRSVGWQLAGGFGAAVLSAASWFAWMGWDTSYDIDPVTQVASGPYQAWQVVGCGVTLLLVLVGALLLGVRAVVACAATTVAFTAAWTTTAASTDETGLFMVGAVLVLLGVAAGSAVVALLTVRWRDASVRSR